ncbi:MAG: type I methionyl aminopeptidase [Candidatus Nomurabacteria bacterium]|jgi:methionyl aminopeptidase|nr:type I methionyl aminopeptidase [Candidatus Nomurabacteria bacterium]
MSEKPLKDFTAAELEQKITAQREGGKIIATILKEMKSHAVAGVTGLELDQLNRELCKKYKVEPTYLKEAKSFGYSICISKNDVLIHGVPNDEPFEDGDKVSFDLTIGHKGWCVDSAFTMVVGGKPNAALKHLIGATEQSFYVGTKNIKAGSRTGEIGSRIEQFLCSKKLGVIKDYIGHGIGRSMHEDPEVPNYGYAKSGAVLEAGQTICVEPMVSLGGIKTKIDRHDGWSVHIADGSLCAHYEHTILILKNGAEILTAW